LIQACVPSESVLVDLAVLHDDPDGFNALSARLGIEPFRTRTKGRRSIVVPNLGTLRSWAEVSSSNQVSCCRSQSFDRRVIGFLDVDQPGNDWS
jgi:hypothetical protein